MQSPTSRTAGQLLLATAIISCCLLSKVEAQSPNPIEEIRYMVEQPLVMNMTSRMEIAVIVTFNKLAIPARGSDIVTIIFQTKTITPQFNILSLSSEHVSFTISRKLLEASKYQLVAKPKLIANYIGHAVLLPHSVEFTDATTKRTAAIMVPQETPRLPVTIVQHEGIWGTIFIISVSILIVISYINLAAQLDEDNMRLVIEKPKTLIMGSIISVIVMPAISWFVGLWFFRDQPLFKIGSFIFAAGPAASASTLWTVMLNSDKELSVGLQVISTLAALVTMPLLLYFMERSLYQQAYHHIQVPYAKLFQTLFVLLVALIVGWRLGRHKKMKQISSKIFRPLVFFVLIFIIVFSSILYWHIYQMFDWNITLASFIITMGTYLISGVLGHIINCHLDQGIAISITSAYKNSGVAFAVLLVAYRTPDTYIAFIPCLTQVVTTSLTLYLTYTIVTLVNYFRRKGQPETIQATTSEDTSKKRRESVEDKEHAKDDDDDENDEFIAMNVTDLDAEAMAASRKASETNATHEQISVKVVGGDGEKDGIRYTTV